MYSFINPYHVGACLEPAESSVRNYLAKMNGKQAIILKNSDVQDKDIRNFNDKQVLKVKNSDVHNMHIPTKL